MRIVICDDHRLLLEALATALSGQGYTIEAAATTPAEAVRAVALHDPDLLLIDVMFPVGSGLDAAREVARQHPRTKVVMITGTDSVEPLVAALEIGVAGYTRKDQRVEAIAGVLELAVRGEQAIDHELLRKVRHTPPTIPRQRSAMDQLTSRERHVLSLLVDGMTTEEIVERIGVSRSTVRTHVQNILAKLGVHSRLQAVAALAVDGSPTVPDGAHAAAR
ncbi:MAG TPA: response regulator transcription factor [Nocardioidaceae bacterium]|nr:response regulator transcription factor [Nocardioidaceae bacterium]